MGSPHDAPRRAGPYRGPMSKEQVRERARSGEASRPLGPTVGEFRALMLLRPLFAQALLGRPASEGKATA